MVQCGEWMICPSVRRLLLWLREDKRGQIRDLEGTYWLLPQWTPRLDSVDRPALVAKDGLVWPCCWLRGPHGAGSLPLVCQVMLFPALRVNEAVCHGESRHYFVPWGQHGAGALPWCASALTFCFGSANVPGSPLSL